MMSVVPGALFGINRYLTSSLTGSHYLSDAKIKDTNNENQGTQAYANLSGEEKDKTLTAYFDAAYAAAEADNRNLALKITDEVIKIKVSEARYLLMALASEYADEDDIAIKYATKAIGLNPQDPNLYMELGFIYQSRGNYQEALNSFKEAIDLAADLDVKFDYYTAFCKSALMKEKLGDFQGALKVH